MFNQSKDNTKFKRSHTQKSSAHDIIHLNNMHGTKHTQICLKINSFTILYMYLSVNRIIHTLYLCEARHFSEFRLLL